MKKVFTLFVVLATSICAFAQTETTKKEIDPLDLSSELKKISDYGIPTVQLVEQMKAKADTLYKNESFSEAAKAYEEYAKKANWLANLLSQCVEPYYSASYDDKKNTPYYTLKSFIPYESAANDLKRNRNTAYVRIGLCYKNLGNSEKAVAYLYKGLDLVNVDEYADWVIASKALAELVGFKPEE